MEADYFDSSGHIINKWETLTCDEQVMVSFISVICAEGLATNVLCNIIMPNRPHDFYRYLDSLIEKGWIFCDESTIFCNNSIESDLLKSNIMEEKKIVRTLKRLKEYLIINPLDDMLSKQEYFVAARLLLTYIMNKWESLSSSSHLKTIFSDVVVTFCTNAELSYYANNRKRVNTLEERTDFQLLYLIKNFSYSGIVHVLLASLYNSIFRYSMAAVSFHKAEEYLGSHDSSLLYGKAIMYENLSLYHHAFQFAYSSFVQSNDNDKIKVALYISYLCAINESPSDSKKWRKVARTLIGNKSIAYYSDTNIMLMLIEALLHQKDASLGQQILDDVELIVIKLYGTYAPLLSNISIIRSIINETAGNLRGSDKNYHQYCKINHFCYGFSVADTAILYSSIINNNVIRGNIKTAQLYTFKLQKLYTETANFSPGVRLSQSLANAVSYLADNNLILSEYYLEIAYKICENEIIPDEITLSEIQPVFSEGIPESIKFSAVTRVLKQLSISISIGKGQFDEAKKIIETEKANESSLLEKLKWNIELGRTLIIEGNIDEGIQVWRETINNSPNTCKFTISKEIAEWALNLNMNFEAKVFYEEALAFDIMVYEKNIYEIANALQCYANVLSYCGFFEGSEDTFKQAELFFKSMDEQADGLALLYLSWATTKQDSEAEILIKKAITYWKPENATFDESLSKMWHQLACVQSMQGKHAEASFSARQAIKYYPSEYPNSLLEDMGPFLQL